MLKELETNFSVLETKILKLKKYNENLQNAYTDLSKEHEELKTKYDDEVRRNQELTEEQKKIKLFSAIQGNSDHNRLMKNHINRLMKEIDACIAQLQNSGL